MPPREASGSAEVRGHDTLNAGGLVGDGDGAARGSWRGKLPRRFAERRAAVLEADFRSALTLHRRWHNG